MRADSDAKITSAREEARVAVEKTAAESSSKIAEARAETEKAIADTAKANERTAELKLALEREITARMPRTIAPELKAAIVTILKADSAPKGRIVVVWKLFDEEAERFAKQVIEVLNEAGFEAVEGQGPLSFGEKGAWIVVRDLKAAATTRTAIGAVQDTFWKILRIQMSGVQRTDPFPDLGEIVIAIGAKP